MSVTSGSDQKESRWPNIHFKQIRFVPFDIGIELNDEVMIEIKESMKKLNYKRYEPGKLKELLTDDILAYTISERHRMFIFSTGICVSVLKDEYDHDSEYFSIDVCQERWNAHRRILYLQPEGDARYLDDGEAIRDIAEVLRHTVTQYFDHLNPFKRRRYSIRNKLRSIHAVSKKAKNDERRGLSYVMTMHVLAQEDKDLSMELDWNCIPKLLRKNIMALLDPAIINMEDAQDSIDEDRREREKLIEKIGLENENDFPIDYERREDIATYMSWSSVVVIGNPTVEDIEEYTLLEVMIQSNWYLIHRREKRLPKTMDEAKKRGITSVALRMEQYKLDMYIEDTTYHGGSTLPARFNDIQSGLLVSSRLSEKIARYRRIVGHMSESMMYDDQLKQRKYGRINEILLFLIAFMNASTIIYGIAKESYRIPVTVLIISIAVIGVIALLRK